MSGAECWQELAVSRKQEPDSGPLAVRDGGVGTRGIRRVAVHMRAFFRTVQHVVPMQATCGKTDKASGSYAECVEASHSAYLRSVVFVGMPVDGLGKAGEASRQTGGAFQRGPHQGCMGVARPCEIPLCLDMTWVLIKDDAAPRRCGACEHTARAPTRAQRTAHSLHHHQGQKWAPSHTCRGGAACQTG